ncbi:MAG: hypothetical protein ABL888_00330 [Pirellulaceae bacterium]
MKKFIVPLICLIAANVCAMTFGQNFKAVQKAPGLKEDVRRALAGSLTAKRTEFDPKKHGFAFENTFQTELVVQNIRFGGLCGGMVYSSLDHFNAKKSIPRQNFRPPVKTPLFENIYARQNQSVSSNADKWAELVFNPLGVRSDEFFRWGLQGTNGGRLEELRREIDAGRPCPLGLFAPGDGGLSAHHQVLAIGYDMGRYKGDLGAHQEDFKIFVYDPNHADEVKTLVADPATKTYHYNGDAECKWQTYFVDKKYRAATPPNIAAPNFPRDGLVHQLQCEFTTGKDDLRGGNDNLNLTIRTKDGKTEVHENINNRGRWIDDYCETVTVNLRRPVKLEDIACVELKTTFGGGPGGDNWNLNQLYIIANIGGGDPRAVYLSSGEPLVRFDGNNTPFKAVAW